MVHRLPEEAGAGHGAHAHLPGQVLAELQVAVVAVLADVQQHVVGALRVVVDDVQVVQTLQKQLLLVGVLGEKAVVVILAELQPRDHRLLERRGAAHGQEVMDLLGPVDDLLRSDDVAQTPAGDGVGLGQGGAGQRPVPHPRQGGEVGVLMGGVDDVLVDLVGDDVGVVLGGHLGDGQQLLPGEHPPAGVGGVAQHQGLGALPEGGLQFVHVEGEGRGMEGHVDGLRSGENGVGSVVLIEGGEHDHLVAGIGHGHHGAHHGLGGAAGGHDLLVGVDGPAHVVRLFSGQGLPEVLGAPGDGILVGTLMGHLGQPVQDLLGRVKVGKSLGQVHGAVFQGDPGHPPDHGIGKISSALGQGLGHWIRPPLTVDALIVPESGRKFQTAEKRIFR